MKKPRNPIFSKNKEALNEMLGLRKQGITLQVLADKYGVDKKCIHQWCEKMGVGFATILKVKAPKKVIHAPRPRIVKTFEQFDEFGERINQGHDYKWYLQKAGLIHRKPKDVL
jgi:hypothetical protein